MESVSENPVDALSQAVTLMHDWLVKHDMSDDEALNTAVHLNRLNKQLKDLAEFAAESAIPVLEKSGPSKVMGYDVEARTGSARKKWDHEGLFTKASRHIRNRHIDFDTGEILGTPEDMMRDLFKLLGVSYWRIKECSKVGLHNVDDYCEVLPPKTSMVITDPDKKGK